MCTNLSKRKDPSCGPAHHFSITALDLYHWDHSIGNIVSEIKARWGTDGHFQSSLCTEPIVSWITLYAFGVITMRPTNVLNTMYSWKAYSSHFHTWNARVTKSVKTLIQWHGHQEVLSILLALSISVTTITIHYIFLHMLKAYSSFSFEL